MQRGMDTVLVAADIGLTRGRLERWLLSAHRLVIRAPALPGFSAQFTAMCEFALAASVLADWGTADPTWGRTVVASLSDRYCELRAGRMLAAIPSSAPGHAWIVEALHANNVESPLPAEVVLRALRERWELPVFTAYPLVRIEALYLSHRLEKATGRRIGATDDGVEISFYWPEQWVPRGYCEIYELVHAVFFLTDFGCGGWDAGRAILTPNLPAVTSSLRRAAELCLGDGHFDLVGEIALAHLCLQAAAGAYPLLKALSEAQLSDGAIPGWRGACDISGLYHATLVSLLAFSRAELCLTRDLGGINPDSLN